MKLTFNWGTGITLVYSAFAVATFGFVAFAMGRPVDLVRGDYYAESLRQDARMAAERNAQALRPVPSIVQTEGRIVLIQLPPTHAGAAGTVTLYRASDASADRTLPLAIDPDGRQRITLDGLSPGSWTVKVAWSAGGNDYYMERAVHAR